MSSGDRCIYSNHHNTRPTRSWAIKQIRLGRQAKLHRCLRVVWLVRLAAVGLYVISTLGPLHHATVCSREKRLFFTAWIYGYEILFFSTDYVMDLSNNIVNGAIIVVQPLCNGPGC
jgi:hypothetical protein